MFSKDILLQQLKEEFLSGWKPFEIIWLLAFVGAQIFAYMQQPDSLLAMVSGISGIICVVLVSKGKVSNYLFGLIFAYTYLYVAWGANYIGEMNSVLYVYLPAQFVGYFTWKANMKKDEDGSRTVAAKSLTPKGWAVMLAVIIIGTLLFVEALKAAGGSSTGLDGLSTVITFVAQLMMVLRYREQWLLWIALNVVSIALWAKTPAMYLMYGAYLVNSVYGYWNWTRLAKQKTAAAQI